MKTNASRVSVMKRKRDSSCLPRPEDRMCTFELLLDLASTTRSHSCIQNLHLLLCFLLFIFVCFFSTLKQPEPVGNSPHISLFKLVIKVLQASWKNFEFFSFSTFFLPFSHFFHSHFSTLNYQVQNFHDEQSSINSPS